MLQDVVAEDEVEAVIIEGESLNVAMDSGPRGNEVGRGIAYRMNGLESTL